METPYGYTTEEVPRIYLAIATIAKYYRAQGISKKMSVTLAESFPSKRALYKFEAKIRGKV